MNSEGVKAPDVSPTPVDVWVETVRLRDEWRPYYHEWLKLDALVKMARDASAAAAAQPDGETCTHEWEMDGDAPDYCRKCHLVNLPTPTPAPAPVSSAVEVVVPDAWMVTWEEGTSECHRVFGDEPSALDWAAHGLAGPEARNTAVIALYRALLPKAETPVEVSDEQVEIACDRVFGRYLSLVQQANMRAALTAALSVKP